MFTYCGVCGVKKECLPVTDGNFEEYMCSDCIPDVSREMDLEVMDI